MGTTHQCRISVALIPQRKVDAAPSFYEMSAEEAKEAKMSAAEEARVNNGHGQAKEFLHGKLWVKVGAAENLPDTDTCFFNIDADDYTDPFVVGMLGTAKIFKTRHINNTLNPVWNEEFDVYVCHKASSLDINVKDKEHVSDDHVASCSIDHSRIIGGETISDWFILYSKGQEMGKISLEIKFTPKAELDEHKLGLEKMAYFPMREGNRVTLYQEADTPKLPQLEGVLHPDGSPYDPTTAWKDLYNALRAAKKFIYITGWSVCTDTNLVRGDDDPDGESNVGELLKQRADEGVNVMVMVWNEALSTEISMNGLMGTHDEKTRIFFEGTNVHCVSVGRTKRKGKTQDALAGAFQNTCYTHHQKTVICDAPMEGESGMRRVIAFVGGLDITNGRYDNPTFPLWSTIQTVHSNDFHNACVPGVTKSTGPRQPWHDNHAKVEGPIALDLMKNFEERCMRQDEDHVNRLVHLSEDEFVIDTPGIVPDHEGGDWSAQLFRSITDDSAFFDLNKQQNLHRKAGLLVERSIMNIMVQKIRNAKNFIYLENQYFLGSSYEWTKEIKTPAMHLIPAELTAKILSKIEAGEDFKVYVVIPMFPEGDPSTEPIQEILYWQYLTMESMYGKIAAAINQAGNEKLPTDYLSFYCLGKRESRECENVNPDEMPEYFDAASPGTLAEAVRISRRHPVYVHSKMTIFDDEYILIGSANINERSLGGNRDSEIAVGAFQPGHTVNEEGDPRGGIHTYRMALWAAHLGGVDEAYLNPGSDDCLAKVKKVSSDFWSLYTAGEPEHSDVHLLPYPIKVRWMDGRVESLPEPFDCFPDTRAKVLGSKSGMIPSKVTT